MQFLGFTMIRTADLTRLTTDIDLWRGHFESAQKTATEAQQRLATTQKAAGEILGTDPADPERMALVVAQMNDHEQAAFLNRLGNAPYELSWGVNNQVIKSDALAGEGQWCHVAKLLNERGRELVEHLAEFLRLEREDAA